MTRLLFALSGLLFLCGLALKDQPPGMTTVERLYLERVLGDIQKQIDKQRRLSDPQVAVQAFAKA